MKLLVLTSRFPYPLEKGDKLRLYYQLCELAKCHEICLVCLNDGAVSPEDYAVIAPLCASIHVIVQTKSQVLSNLFKGIFNGLPMQVSYFYNTDAHRQIRTVIAAQQPEHIYCQLIRMAPYYEGCGVPATIDFMDAYAYGAARWAADVKWWQRPFWQWEARRTAALERHCAKQFKHQLVITEKDKTHLFSDTPDTIKVLPNGIDMAFFERDPTVKIEYDIVFVGNMGYVPNIDAALFLVKKVLPLLLAKYPNLRILLAGARPSNAVLQLASDNVTVSGWMDDIRLAYNSSRIFVAPLFLSIGQQNKVLESMAMSVPVIASSVVNSAYAAVPETHLLLADTPKAFAEQIDRLLSAPDLQTTLTANARTWISQNYSWAAFGKQLADVF